MARVEFRAVSKAFPDGTRAVDDFSMTIEDGELMVVVGPSGCGKSTTLRMLAGLEQVTSGEIVINGRDVSSLPPQQRDIAMVFQNYALYPHKSVRGNLEFPLRMARWDRRRISGRVMETARLLELEHLLDRKPAQLSGGQRQRVAMGRALVREPAVFLMDEPLSNLDAQLRGQMRREIAALQRRLGTTTMYVTHDQVEAMTMGDRLAVLNRGRLQQVGTPQEVYDRPANVFVATFIGSPRMNLIESEVLHPREGRPRLRFGPGDVELPHGFAETDLKAGSRVIIGLRPEAFRIDERSADLDSLQAKAASVEALGHEQIVQFTTPLTAVNPERAPGDRDPENAIIARIPAQPRLSPGQAVTLSFDPSQLHVFSADGTALRRTVR